MSDRYSIEMRWSLDDKGYIATVPDLPGCSAFGETRQQAAVEIGYAIEAALEARSNADAVPCAHVGYSFASHGRYCPCGALMELTELQMSLLGQAKESEHLVVALPPPILSVPVSSHIHTDSSLLRRRDEQGRLDGEYLKPANSLVSKGLLRLVDYQNRQVRYAVTKAGLALSTRGE